MITNDGSELGENISPMIILDKINAMEARIENHFSQVHLQMDELRCDFKQAMEDVKESVRETFKQAMESVKESVREIEKSLEFSWAAIEDVQLKSKVFKDSKRSYQEMLDKQTNL